jgi:DNA-binding transcriptional LysR family regulator
MRISTRSTLRILADETVSELILKSHIAAFLAANPLISIEVDRCAGALGRGRTEAALVLKYMPSLLAGAGAEMLNVQKLVTCAAPHYLRERGLPHHPRDLCGQFDALVIANGLKAPFAWRFENATKKLSIEPQVRAVTPSPSTALALTMAGIGIAQIPECWAINQVRTGSLVRLLQEWEPRVHLRAIVPHGRPEPDARAFIRFIQTLLETGGPGRSASWDMSGPLPFRG